MEQELLHKMFRGEATDQELAAIRQWVNADQATEKLSSGNAPFTMRSN